ncbi:hypothetical protein MKZ38_004139 [Zalerion maritima]|uniref:Uncharacterized protein n=1 Tax=Zalerion maritima TaxID=339359 RepID=A0AAD5WR90_9PEZI|nr:hypothetical protein MKZ38_004139 [Zalerion maritima]
MASFPACFPSTGFESEDAAGQEFPPTWDTDARLTGWGFTSRAALPVSVITIRFWAAGYVQALATFSFSPSPLSQFSKFPSTPQVFQEATLRRPEGPQERVTRWEKGMAASPYPRQYDLSPCPWVAQLHGSDRCATPRVEKRARSGRIKERDNEEDRKVLSLPIGLSVKMNRDGDGGYASTVINLVQTISDGEEIEQLIIDARERWLGKVRQGEHPHQVRPLSARLSTNPYRQPLLASLLWLGGANGGNISL